MLFICVMILRPHGLQEEGRELTKFKEFIKEKKQTSRRQLPAETAVKLKTNPI